MPRPRSCRPTRIGAHAALRFALLVLVLVVVVAGCNGPRGRSNSDPDGGRIGVAPPFECLPGINCVADVDCPDGHHCNDALAPPACELLFCGPANSACSEDAQCEEGLECWGGLCTLCNGCGAECLVDFANDPDHCGSCDGRAPVGGSCVDGTPACPAGRTICGGACVDTSTDPSNCGGCGVRVPSGARCELGAGECSGGLTRCGSACVDLRSDDAHCGACNRAVPGSLSCIDGTPGCWGGGTACDGTCVDASSDSANCGACGHACPSGTACDLRVCTGERSSRTRQSCDTLCAADGGRCVEGASSVICGSGFLPGAVGIACATMPPSSCDSSGAGPQPFYSVNCRCAY